MTRHAFSTTDLNRLQRQLSAWRQKRTGRTRLPEAVWGAATDLARTQGPSLVARALGLDYYKLRQRLTGTSSFSAVPATFVEVKGAPRAGADGGESSVLLRRACETAKVAGAGTDGADSKGCVSDTVGGAVRWQA